MHHVLFILAISSRDIFSYLEGLCIYSQEEKQRLIRGRPVTYVYEYISQVACEKVSMALTVAMPIHIINIVNTYYPTGFGIAKTSVTSGLAH